MNDKWIALLETTCRSGVEYFSCIGVQDIAGEFEAYGYSYWAQNRAAEAAAWRSVSVRQETAL